MTEPRYVYKVLNWPSLPVIAFIRYTLKEDSPLADFSEVFGADGEWHRFEPYARLDEVTTLPDSTDAASTAVLWEHLASLPVLAPEWQK